MGIKTQILREIALKKSIRKGEFNIKGLAKATGLSYSGLRRWIKEDGRSIGDSSLDKIAEVLGKKLILVDKDIWQ